MTREKWVKYFCSLGVHEWVEIYGRHSREHIIVCRNCVVKYTA